MDGRDRLVADSAGPYRRGGVPAVPPPFPLPPDVIAFIDGAFARCNARVAARLSHLPTVHETHLDLCFIETLSEVAVPHVTSSQFIVDLDVHFLGQGRHWQSWEVADIGLIVTYRRAGRLIRTKIALLQSKRLYPRESEFVEDEPLSKLGGFGDLRGPAQLAAQIPRVFHFDQTCRYRALQVGDEQWKAIASYEEAYRIPIHYLLYHPRTLPSHQVIPVIAGRPPRLGKPTIGCRILRSDKLRASAMKWPRNYAPSYRDLKSAILRDRIASTHLGMRLEGFVSEQILNCHEGYIANNEESDAGLIRVFSQRSAPISAALRVDINAPEEVDLADTEDGQ